jgi:hypothetical protein
MEKLDKTTDEELRKYLKDTYKINFNVSDNLSVLEKQEVIDIIENNEAIQKLVLAFVSVNKKLGNNNRFFGRQRSNAERKLEESKEENNRLSTEISQIRYKYDQLKKMLSQNLQVTYDKLVDNMVERSELIQIVKGLISVVDHKKKVFK